MRNIQIKNGLDFIRFISQKNRCASLQTQCKSKWLEKKKRKSSSKKSKENTIKPSSSHLLQKKLIDFLQALIWSMAWHGRWMDGWMKYFFFIICIFFFLYFSGLSFWSRQEKEISRFLSRRSLFPPRAWCWCLPLPSAWRTLFISLSSSIIISSEPNIKQA